MFCLGGVCSGCVNDAQREAEQQCITINQDTTLLQCEVQFRLFWNSSKNNDNNNNNNDNDAANQHHYFNHAS